MKTTIHRAATRGFADHGWLRSHHSFSFAGYYDPTRMGFGKLRVLNDDWVAPAMGFGTHGHDNMEIVSVPLAGALRHADSMGHTQVLRPGDIQVMSAGTGVTHSEFNDSTEEAVCFLQIWVRPKRLGVAPRYDQRRFDAAGRADRFQLLVSPDGRAGSLTLNQEAYFSLAELSAGARIGYTAYAPSDGLYLFLIDGEVHVAGATLEARDALGIEEAPAVEVHAVTASRLLAIEVPMA